MTLTLNPRRTPAYFTAYHELKPDDKGRNRYTGEVVFQLGTEQVILSTEDKLKLAAYLLDGTSEAERYAAIGMKVPGEVQA